MSLKSVLFDKGLPLLANVFSGGTAGTALNLIKAVTGFNFNDEDHLEKVISNRPDLLVKLKEFEINQKVELEKLAVQSSMYELEQSKAYLQDKQNARIRESEITKATGQRDWLMMSLAIVVVIGFFSLIAVMIIGENAQKVTGNGPINQLFGALVAGFSMVLSYFFGSSKGSADKDKTIARQSNQSASHFNF